VKVRWTPEAERDREDVLLYIAADNPLAAIGMDDLFSEAAERLADFPLLGPAGTIPGTRELIPHESYRLVYEVEEETVWILALVKRGKRGQGGIFSSHLLHNLNSPTPARRPPHPPRSSSACPWASLPASPPPPWQRG